jgi:hypothetical protein
MNKQESGPEVYWRGAFAFALFGLIVINLGMIALGVARYPALLLQSGARTFVAEPISVLVAYALAVVYIARTHGTYWDRILRTAISFGLLAGTFEIINIGMENGIPFSVRGPALQIAFMLSVFTSWGFAGFRTARSLGSIRAGLLAAVCRQASVCSLRWQPDSLFNFSLSHLDRNMCPRGRSSSVAAGLTRTLLRLRTRSTQDLRISSSRRSLR